MKDKNNTNNSIMKTMIDRVQNVNLFKNLFYWCVPIIASFYLLIQRRSLYFFITVLCVCICLFVITSLCKNCLNKRVPGFWLYAFILSSAISVGKYLVFCDVGDVDMACYVNVLSNTTRGHFFFQSFLKQNFLAIHSSAALLVFLPVFIVAGNIGILIAQAAFWSFGLYMIFRSNTNYKEIPSLFCLSVAISPYLIGSVFYGFHVDILVLPAAGIALFAYKQRRLALFIGMSIVLLMVKEVFILIPFLFSCLAFIEKRKLKWILFPSVIAVAYLLLYMFFLAPQLRMDTPHVFSGFFPKDIHSALLNIFSYSSVQFTVISLLLYLPLLMLAPKFLIFPISYILFYAIFPDQSFRDPWRHYVLSIGTVSLFPIAWAKPFQIQKLTVPMFIVAICALPLWIQLVIIKPPALEHIKKTYSLIQSIPIENSLIVHGPFMSQAAGRFKLDNWIYKPSNWYTYDYLLFDTSFKPAWWSGGSRIDTFVDSLSGTDNWDEITRVENLILLKRSGM